MSTKSKKYRFLFIFVICLSIYALRNKNDSVEITRAFISKCLGSNLESINSVVGKEDDVLVMNNGVKWYIYNDKNKKMHFQIATKMDKIIAFYIKGSDYKSVKPNKKAKIKKGTFIRNYEGYSTIHYLDDDKTVNSILYVDSSIVEDFELLYSDAEIYAKQVFYLILYERSMYNQLKPDWNEQISVVSENYCRDMIEEKIFSHIDNENRTVSDRLEGFKLEYTNLAENLVRGNEISSFQAHNMLMNSLGHKLNILDPKIEYVGIGVYSHLDMTILCEIFAY